MEQKLTRTDDEYVGTLPIGLFTCLGVLTVVFDSRLLVHGCHCGFASACQPGDGSGQRNFHLLRNQVSYILTHSPLSRSILADIRSISTNQKSLTSGSCQFFEINQVYPRNSMAPVLGYWDLRGVSLREWQICTKFG